MDEPRTLRLLSVVAPVFNEESLIEEFYGRVREALDGLPFELLLVDDGSTDGTPERLRRLADGDPRVKVIELARNFGHQTALTAGLDHAQGDAVVMLDADLQDPPELITTMLDHWYRGTDVVYAVRRARAGETRLKLATARWFYKLFSVLADTPLEHDSGDYRLLDRKALDALLSMRERNRFLRGMTVWVGFTQAAVAYDRGPRHSGETKYTLRKMIRFSLDAITSFSHVPLQLATSLGFLLAGLSLIGIVIAIILRLVTGAIAGQASTLILVLFLGGIQLIFLGIIGEYLGRIYDEVRARPLYIVHEVLE
jgi:dolichol-phosphate mannosyltransferase